MNDVVEHADRSFEDTVPERMKTTSVTTDLLRAVIRSDNFPNASREWSDCMTKFVIGYLSLIISKCNKAIMGLSTQQIFSSSDFNMFRSYDHHHAANSSILSQTSCSTAIDVSLISSLELWLRWRTHNCFVYYTRATGSTPQQPQFVITTVTTIRD
jgi:hypothetical protein